MSKQAKPSHGAELLYQARKKSTEVFSTVFLFSMFVNFLMLTGPLFMLQVYDRVLGSRSEETLVMLLVLVAMLYFLMGILDWARGRVMARAGAKFQSLLDHDVFNAVLKRSILPSEQHRHLSGLQDLESIQRFMSAPAASSFFDIPWTPLYFAAIFMFHPWLGILALFGAVVLVILTLLNQFLTKKLQKEANIATAKSDYFIHNFRKNGEIVQGLGMRHSILNRWDKVRGASLTSTIKSSDLTGSFSVISKTFRLFLQSAMLALGAYLVIQGEMTAGAMIAGSILLGRGLAPIEQSIAQWPMLQRARTAWQSLVELLDHVQEEPNRIELPEPAARLEFQEVAILPPESNKATARRISMKVEQGQALGIIGASGSGKSSIARGIMGIWKPIAGKILLDGIPIQQYDPDKLGRYFGYLPQDVVLFDGSIADNIARMDEEPSSEAIVAAAKAAQAHEIITALPQGYDTIIRENGGMLSGGQKQRIGLARALYGDPKILVLDEPNSNLDHVGTVALNQAIKHMKNEHKAVILIAHRPAAISECDTLLVMKDGDAMAFGPRDEVLKAQTTNHQNIRKEITHDVRPKITNRPHNE